jgi:hypothetical protein
MMTPEERARQREIQRFWTRMIWLAIVVMLGVAVLWKALGWKL